MNYFKNKKSANYKGSSEHLKKKFNVHKIVNFRMKFFIGICVFLAAILIYRMYYIQIVNASHYHALYEKYQTPDDKYNTKRGDMTDRNGGILVSSKGINNIVYVQPKSLKDSERWDTAEQFALAFEMEFTLTQREAKDLWLRLNKDVELFSEEELAEQRKETLSQSEIDRLKREKITDEMLATLDEQDQETFKVYLLMSNPEENSTSVIHKDASSEDIAYLAEHQDQFLGFSSQVTWDRAYNPNSNLGSIFGRIGQSSIEKSPYYIAQNYAYNDIVGVSGLEYQYEQLLKGTKSIYSKDGRYGELIQKSEGRPGYDIRLSIDSDLQAFLEAAIIEELESIKNNPIRALSDNMNAVITDPNTGDILAMAGMVRSEDGTYYNDPQRLLLNSSTVGSVVKPVTVYMGLNEGAISPGQTFYDAPMYIQGTPPRKSWKNLGNVNDITALQHSSNVYMFYITIALAESNYVPHGPLIFKDLEGTMMLMRNYYSQFGLGVQTGIDYPNEEVGYKGNTTTTGLALEFSIGQYDNYTTMQLGQYVNTLANGGYRLRPRLVIDAGDFSKDQVIYENPVSILNTIENKEALERVREGMRMCDATGVCGAFRTGSITGAGKTGTAQTVINGVRVANHNFIAFAPYEKPEIAMACVQPSAYYDNGGSQLNQCSVLSKKIVDYYFK